MGKARSDSARHGGLDVGIGIAAGALCGGFLTWVLVALSFLTGHSSAWAVTRYAALNAALGSVFGAAVGPAAALLHRKPWKAAVLGVAAAFLIYGSYFLWLWNAGAFHTLQDVARGAATAIPGVAAVGAAIGWATAWLVRAVENARPLPAASRRWGLACGAVLFAFAAALWGMGRYRATAAARETCKRFAQAFATGDVEAILDTLPLATHRDVDADEVRYWAGLLKPLLPQGGQIVVEPVRIEKRGSCTCRARVVGATYSVAPRSPAAEASFRVSLQSTLYGWKVYPVTEAVSTYLATLYGEEAGRAWQRFLVEHAGSPPELK